MESRSLERGVGRHGKNVVIISILLSLISSWTPAMALTNTNDVKVLNTLKQKWGGMTSLWRSGSDPCFDKWVGVTCDSTTNSNVTTLVMVSANLGGGLPPVIGSLHALQTLDLSFNNLAGTLPVELGNLKELTALSLQSCGFTGPIPPSISHLKSLAFLALNNNNLSGPIPSSLGSLSKMGWFDLSSNNLNGSIPVSSTSRDGHGLDMLRINKHFHLNNNSLSGQLPPELGNATYALHMLLENNAFTGPIPESFGNLRSLKILSLSNNQLTEKIPTSLNRTTQGLTQLRVANNFLTGSVPNFSNLSQLGIVDFSNNKFELQPFPAWLNKQKQLQTIMIDYGNLIGPIPADVLAYPYLQRLSLRGNVLNGTLTIPANLSSSLEVVSMQDNKITNIYQSPFSNQSLVQQLQLELGNNTICTSSNVISKPNATVCNIRDPTLGKWKPLQSSNCEACESPLVLNAAENCSCATPLEITLQIRNPMFSVLSDSLMDQLRNQTAQMLGLQREQVLVYNAVVTPSKRVEVSMYFFPNDSSTSLDQATQNKITSSFTMQIVKYDTTFTPYLTFFVGNPADLTASSHRLSRGAIIGTVFGVIAALFIIALSAVAILQKRRADRAEEMSRPIFASWGEDGVDNGEAPQLRGARRFTFIDLKKATRNFSEFNEIGSGGYGRVYKGILHTSGEFVAVKRARKDSMQGAQEFKTEIELLSRVHHINLVGLVGFCYEQGEQMLVYEYMPNGTLTEWLLGRRRGPPLDWRRRMLIALGSARGLAYLHSLANPPIIHRDVKSDNILLDRNLVAKVADFGLSKLAPEAGQELETDVKGTMGYFDPEYFMTRNLSDKSDVYSFGVVMLELLCGRPPIHRSKYIVREVKIALDKGGIPALRPLLDPEIVGHIPAQDLKHFLELALPCVEERGEGRPSKSWRVW